MPFTEGTPTLERGAPGMGGTQQPPRRQCRRGDTTLPKQQQAGSRHRPVPSPCSRAVTHSALRQLPSPGMLCPCLGSRTEE